MKCHIKKYYKKLKKEQGQHYKRKSRKEDDINKVNTILEEFVLYVEGIK